MKVLLWLLIVLAIVVWMYRGKKSVKGSAPRDGASFSGAPGGDAETMLRCAHCGTYLPASEALRGSSDAAFCSEEHRRLGAVHR